MSQYLDEGYIKFDIDWEKGDPPKDDLMPDVMRWRDKMYELGLIGFYEQFQVGYGNISIKTNNGIIISGTQTGHLPTLLPEHYTRVDQYDIDQNKLHCIGSVKASSESLTHAAIYECDPTIKAVVHIHHDGIWQRALHQLPASSANVPYGTPEMAYEILRLYREGNLGVKKMLVMEGHKGGLISFGTTLKDACERAIALLSTDETRTN